MARHRRLGRVVVDTSVVIRAARAFRQQPGVHHPIPKAPGYRILKRYMQVRGLRQIDLQPILVSRGVTSEIVNGKLSITKAQTERLGEFFGVSAAVFI